MGGEMVKNIKYLVIDVDGTMTDAGIYYDMTGNEYKKFSTRDAAAFFVARCAGIKIIVMTGRECEATVRRMEELKVDYLFQNIKNKKERLKEFMYENNIAKEEIAYIGDDLNDLSAMTLAGFIACPADSCKEVIQLADYVSPVMGGYGAVRNIVEHLLSADGQWGKMVRDIYCL